MVELEGVKHLGVTTRLLQEHAAWHHWDKRPVKCTLCDHCQPTVQVEMLI